MERCWQCLEVLVVVVLAAFEVLEIRGLCGCVRSDTRHVNVHGKVYGLPGEVEERTWLLPLLDLDFDFGLFPSFRRRRRSRCSHTSSSSSSCSSSSSFSCRGLCCCLCCCRRGRGRGCRRPSLFPHLCFHLYLFGSPVRHENENTVKQVRSGPSLWTARLCKYLTHSVE